jgi:4-diphosphocytidyl-2-C-methyl-D-erythritol kinase
MSQPFFIFYAPAKVNLTLTITARRDDGYHLLDSLFVFCDLNDVVTIEPSEVLELATLSGPFAPDIEHAGGNLVIRAAHLLQRAAGTSQGARLSLAKNIPVAAGLGGGSADAAATLLALNQFWALQWPLERLHVLAASLGADVPACLASKPVFARGIGDILSPAPDMPDCSILLVNPRVSTPTPAVFKAYKAEHPEVVKPEIVVFPDRLPDLAALVQAIEPRGNDLLAAALSVSPVISDVLTTLRSLPGAQYCSMSGSGATCFALFETRSFAMNARVLLAKLQPSWWAWNGHIIDGSGRLENHTP